MNSTFLSPNFSVKARGSLRWLGMCLMVLVGNLPALAATTITVNPAGGANYTTIAAAVAAAAPNDIIECAAGIYPSSGNTGVTLDKAITLKGAQAGVDARTRGPNGFVGLETVMPATTGPVVFYLNASGITIDGFMFPDMGPRGFDSYTNLGNTNNLTIRNNIFKSTTGGYGVGNIQLTPDNGGRADNFTFEQNYVQNLNGNMILMEQQMDNGAIRNNYINGDTFAFGPFGNRTGWVIEGNEFNGDVPGFGPYWGYGINGNLGDVTIRDNYVHKMYVGMGQISVVGGTISGNTFDDNAYAALQLWGGEYGSVVSGNVTIQNNLIKYDGTPTTVIDHTDASHGVRLRPTDYPNPLTDDPNGIDATTIHFQYNNFTDLAVGAPGQAWAIRNTVGPTPPIPTTLADAANNWWGLNTGPAGGQTDGYETTTPYITAYTNDPTKVAAYGFWPLFAVSTTTQVSASSIDPSGSVSDTATMTASGTSGVPRIDPTGTVQFSYCYNASIAPTSCLSGTAIGSPVALTDDLTADGVTTATLSNWNPPDGAGYYLLHADYGGDAFHPDSADDGTNESVTVAAAVSLISIAVTPATPTIPKSTDLQFTATGTYSDASHADLTGSVTWASATLAKATITSGGLAHGVSQGTSLISATSGLIVGSTLLTVGPAVPSKYVVTVSSLAPIAGSIVTVTAQLTDTANSPVALANVVVTWSKTGIGGSFSASTSKTNSSGRASISFTTTGFPAGVTYTVTATDTASRTGTSPNFTTVVGPLHHLVLSPPTATVAVYVNQSYTATGYDKNNNSLGDVTSTSSFAIAGGACSLNVCRSSVTGNHTVTGTKGTAKGTATLTVTAGDPDHLAFGQQPTNTKVNTAINPAVTVKILDLYGNLVNTSVLTTIVGLGSNPTGATLSGTLSVNAVNGVATFSNLKIDKTGTGYTLAASTTLISVFGATSSKFNIVTATRH